jgi:hypothetical protein
LSVRPHAYQAWKLEFAESRSDVFALLTEFEL